MQEAEPETSRHTAFAPHGDGWHGFNGVGGVITKIEDHKLLAFTIFSVFFATFFFFFFFGNSLGRGLHWINGSPVKSVSQKHIGV